jgi:hypothetical protein
MQKLKSVDTSVDAARRSACATSEMRSSQRLNAWKRNESARVHAISTGVFLCHSVDCSYASATRRGEPSS